jgi:hypothetical protein
MLSVEQAMQLFHALVYDGLRVDVLHAEHTAAQREATVSKFRAGQVLTSRRPGEGTATEAHGAWEVREVREGERTTVSSRTQARVSVGA